MIIESLVLVLLNVSIIRELQRIIPSHWNIKDIRSTIGLKINLLTPHNRVGTKDGLNRNCFGDDRTIASIFLHTLPQTWKNCASLFCLSPNDASWRHQELSDDQTNNNISVSWEVYKRKKLPFSRWLRSRSDACAASCFSPCFSKLSASHTLFKIREHTFPAFYAKLMGLRDSSTSKSPTVMETRITEP